MTVIKSEFFLALNQVATERGISLDDVLDSIKSAVLAAYKKDYGTPELDETEYEVKLDQESGEMHIVLDGKDITPPGFGRIAAQTARQVILQKIREAEKKEVVKHFSAKLGSIIRGRVIRYDGRNVYFDIGKAEGFLPSEEKIRNEDYRLNSPFMLYIKEIADDNYSNSRIIVSRADPRLVEELFRKEVPEIANETVHVKSVVRSAGDRTKIAVYSNQSGVDPVGACVGQKGIRVKAVNDDLGIEEKIDIIQYNEDDVFFIREALSPAKVLSVEIDTDAPEGVKRANVHVDADQAPLAIGKGGINVNLAAELTGYDLNIVQTEAPKEEKPKTEDIAETVEEAPETPADTTPPTKTSTKEKKKKSKK
ncbi:MAG: transcription termination factor NusA [Candidatus Roizmanbacteria bacterium]